MQDKSRRYKETIVLAMDDDSFCLFFSGKILLLALCWKKHWHENNHLTFSLCISLEKWYIGRLEGANIGSTLYFRFLFGYLIRRTYAEIDRMWNIIYIVLYILNHFWECGQIKDLRAFLLRDMYLLLANGVITFYSGW